MKNIAIVILNWNGKQLLKQFLPHVIRHSDDARIIVADNASTDESIAYIEKNYPSVEIIRNQQNGGFAKGYNDALKLVNTEFYILLNSDVEVAENWLKPLSDTMKNPNIAGCQPKILAYNNREYFEHAGAVGGFIDTNYFPFCRGRIFTEVEKDLGQYENESEIFWATGACMMIRAELFHKANGFDEDFFAHMEEIDLCWRIKKWGYSFVAVPKSKVYHVGGGTLPYSSPKKVYYNFRNNLFMITKNHAGLLIPKIFVRMLLDGVAASVFLVKGEVQSFVSVFNSHIAFYKKLSSLLKKRKQIKQGTTNFNDAGMYKGSIIAEFYLKKNRTFSKLDKKKIL